MKRAAKKNHQVKYYVYKAFGTIESICDINSVIKYLKDVSHTEEAKEKLGSL